MEYAEITYINEKLCVPAKWLYSEISEKGKCLPAIISRDAYDKSLNRGKIHSAGHPGPGKPAMVIYDKLDSKFKMAIMQRLGCDPYKLIKKNIIERAVMPDNKAADFFMNYQKPDGSYLKNETQTEYLVTSWILNAVGHIIANRKSMLYKKALGSTLGEMWQALASEIQGLDKERFPHKLPANPLRLKSKYEKYAEEGYESLVHKNLGNQSASKTAKDEQGALLMQLLSHGNNLDNMQITTMYNLVAEPLGWQKISSSTVARRKQELELMITTGRDGLTELRNTKTMQVKRSAPSSAMLYWTLDGWVAELLYQKVRTDSKGYNTTTYHNRLTIVIVLDPCVKYPIGYAIGTHESPELIKEALKNAAIHTGELFGEILQPVQLQSDNYGRGNLTEFYTSMTKFYTPARAHNAKSKVVEPYFRYFNKFFCQTQSNWSGQGLTSKKKNQPNGELKNLNKKEMPDEAGCRAQLITLIEMERKTKIDAYMRAYEKLLPENRLSINETRFLDLFGEQTGYTNKLTAAGVVVKLLGEKRYYDSFDLNFRKNANEDWTIKYFADDLTKVLAVSKDGSKKFLLQEKYMQPMALADRKEGDAEELERVNAFNKMLEAEITDFTVRNAELTESILQDERISGTLTKLMLTDSRGQHKDNKNGIAVQKSKIKLEKQEVKEQKRIDKTFNEEVDEYIDTKLNIDKYID
jgi:hypothetical protein